MNIVLIGAVNSSLSILNKLIEHKAIPKAVFGYQSDNTSHISGYENLEPTAIQAGIDFHGFVRINEHYKTLRSYQPDIIFVVGLSQLVSDEIIKLPKYGCVGFHPTALPLGRGRAPLAWILLDNCPAAATFFRIGVGADDGPIYAQKRIAVTPNDDIASLTKKMLFASDAAMDDWLPKLKNEQMDSHEQDHSKATYYAKRIDRDGQISLAESATSVHRLIRATSRPYPGAYLVYEELKIRVWKAAIVNSTITAVPGSIVEIDSDGSFTIQAASGHIQITDFSADEGQWSPAVGMRFALFSGLSWPVKNSN